MLPPFQTTRSGKCIGRHDLLSVREALKIVRHTALQTMVHVIVTAPRILVVIGATIKLKLFGSAS